MTEAWEVLHYPAQPFGPPSEPSRWFSSGWMTAIEPTNNQGGVMPVYPTEYVYTLPSFFFQMEPSDQRNPVYYDAWQNLATTLMPEWGSESLWGDVHNWPSFFQQISTPTFLPDGIGVTSPTTTVPSPGVGSGRAKTERV